MINPDNHAEVESKLKEYAHLSGLPLPPFDKRWGKAERQQITEVFISGENRIRRRLKSEKDVAKRQELEAQLAPDFLNRAQSSILDHNNTLPVQEEDKKK